jgi:hypothetical protein
LLRRLADEARAAGRPVFEADLAALATLCAFVAACRAILRQRPAVVVVGSAELCPRGRRLRRARPLPQPTIILLGSPRHTVLARVEFDAAVGEAPGPWNPPESLRRSALAGCRLLVDGPVRRIW